MSERATLPRSLGTARLRLRCLRAGDGPRLHAALTRVRQAGPVALATPDDEAAVGIDVAVAVARRHCADFAGGARCVYGIFAGADDDNSNDDDNSDGNSDGNNDRDGDDGDGNSDGGELVGCAHITPSTFCAGAVSIGYWIDPPRRGNGYATEVAGALATLAFARLPITRVEILCDATNGASAHIAERLGFTLEATLRRWIRVGDADHDQMIWRLDREQHPRSPAAAITLAITNEEDEEDDDDDDDRDFANDDADTPPRPDDIEELWSLLVEPLVARHHLRYRDARRVVIEAPVRLSGERHFIQDVLVELGSDRRGAPWLMLKALIGGESLSDPRAALRHNATLAVGAMAIEDDALLLRAGIDPRAIQPRHLEPMVRLLAHEATRLRVACAPDDRAAAATPAASSLQSWWIR